MSGVACEKCSTQMVAVTKRAAYSLASFVAMLLLLGGIVYALVFNTVVGLIVILIAVVLRFAGPPMRTTMTCPACGHQGRTL